MGDFNYYDPEFVTVNSRIRQNMNHHSAPNNSKLRELFSIIKRDYKEAFELAGSLNLKPKFTVWTGIPIDYIYVKGPLFTRRSVKAYPFYSDASDHIAMILDLHLS